jgi:hypothetical protein
MHIQYNNVELHSALYSWPWTSNTRTGRWVMPIHNYIELHSALYSWPWTSTMRTGRWVMPTLLYRAPFSPYLMALDLYYQNREVGHDYTIL